MHKFNKIKKIIFLLNLFLIILIINNNAILAYKLEFDSAQILGTKNIQEDRYNQIITENFSIFLVCDGHGIDSYGCFVSDYLFANLLNKIIQHQYFNEHPERALYESFENINREICGLLSQNRIEAGSTATVVLIKNNKIYFAWVGDSPAILHDTNGKILLKTIDHKLSNEKEATRVGYQNIKIYQEDNNYPTSDRIGYVNMSRSIGDLKAKKKGSIATPEIISYEIPEQQEFFIVIASDGLVDKWLYLAEEETLINECIDQAANVVVENSKLAIFQADLLKLKSEQFRNQNLEDILLDRISKIIILEKISEIARNGIFGIINNYLSINNTNFTGIANHLIETAGQPAEYVDNITITVIKLRPE
ncbi:MAG: PP2C family protein-serine/threonine phosphatase [Candidatus Babeliales bacterium]